jgi:glycosyltransferase involved in cell wall biosynthesis
MQTARRRAPIALPGVDQMQPKRLYVGFLTGEYIIPPDKLEGGLATYVQKTARGLAAKGHDVSVFCLSDRNADWIDQGVQVHEVRAEPFWRLWGPFRFFQPVREAWRTFENSSRLAARLLQIHNERPLDVIQAASYQSVGIALCHNGRIPLITRISSSSPLYRRADGKTGSPLAVLTDWCETYQVGHSDRSYAPSQLMVACFSSSGRTNPQLLRTPVDVYAGELDPSFYNEHLKGLKYLLFFGTLNQMKGVKVLSRAIRPLLQEHADLHVVFIGRAATASARRTYAEYVQEENAAAGGRVLCFPLLPKSELYPAIRNAHGVVLPSIIDNYPNTCLEAMQFGRIVVGTQGSSIDEMIVDGQTGFLVRPNDVGSLQAGIRRLLILSPSAHQEMEKRVEGAFAVIESEDRLGQLLDFYREAIEDYAAPREQPDLGAGRMHRRLWAAVLSEGASTVVGALRSLLRAFVGRPKSRQVP